MARTREIPRSKAKTTFRWPSITTMTACPAVIMAEPRAAADVPVS